MTYVHGFLVRKAKDGNSRDLTDRRSDRSNKLLAFNKLFSLVVSRLFTTGRQLIDHPVEILSQPLPEIEVTELQSWSRIALSDFKNDLT